jgi:hypothetical protein
MKPATTSYMRLYKAVQMRLPTNSKAVHKGQSTTLRWLNTIDATSRTLAGSGADKSRGRFKKGNPDTFTRTM